VATNLKAGRVELSGQVIGHHKTNVVAGVGVFGADVAQAKNQKLHNADYPDFTDYLITERRNIRGS
jgi:hypothetical protein